MFDRVRSSAFVALRVLRTHAPTVTRSAVNWVLPAPPGLGGVTDAARSARMHLASAAALQALLLVGPVSSSSEASTPKASCMVPGVIEAVMPTPVRLR